MSRVDEVIALLSDGQFHSGEHIGQSLGISRSAIWKITKQLDALGIEIHRVQGRGYCIPGGIQFFSQEKVRSFLSEQSLSRLSNVNVLNKVDSTNTYLMEQAKAGASNGTLCLAEYQSAGRGRRDRHWVSPYGKNVYMSLLWNFDAGPSALNGLTLLVGLAIIKALTRLNISGLTLKWPNDVMWRGQKLAGVLTEINVDDVNGCQAIIGLGLNLYLSSKARHEVSNRITDLQTIIGSYPDKNYVTSLLVDELLNLLPEFETHGFANYMDQWQAYDHLLNKQIILQTTNDKVTGVAQGVDASGALSLNINGDIRKFYSGEASIEGIS